MKDLTNHHFNNWLVVKEGVRSACNKRQWHCVCKCGTEKLVDQQNLLSGKSTGCLLCRPKTIKHGQQKHPLYSTWKSMNARCNNPNTAGYANYGGRGIKVCKEWSDFAVFLEEMEPTWQKGLTLDRKKNDLGYCKSNCRWANQEEQSNNKRNSLQFELNGTTYTEAQLARKTGVNRTTIQTRRLKGATVNEMIHGFK